MHRLSSLSFIAVLALLLFTLSAQAVLPHKWEATNFCKCICFGSNYTILHMTHPDNPNKPCLSCTKQWCLNQNLGICAGAKLGDADPDTATGKEGDVEARCFQRDSPRDQLVVTIFLLTVIGLLLGASIKNRMLKAGFDASVPWNASRRWWEGWAHQRQVDYMGLRDGLFNRSTNERRDEEYYSLTDSPSTS